jgi:hypothetical protein
MNIGLKHAPLLVLLGCSLCLTACEPLSEYQVDCGPVEPSACAEAVEEIRSALLPQMQGRGIASIELFSEAEALVTLDDGTPVGWNSDGRR